MTKTPGEKYMNIALDLAAKAEDRTYPNPMVGAVIVKKGRVLGRGYHRCAGADHAEVAAIKDASGKCSGAEMFVTLEPCDHHGRTGPCTRAIIASGVKAVNIAMKDPNRLNNGSGIRRLRRSGIKVNVGLCSDKARILNRKYIKYVTEGLPYVTVKLAQSIDGKIAARDGSSKWISSEASRRYVGKMRRRFDAVMVGINTVLKDDPFLLDEKRRGYRTSRVVLDTRLRIPVSSNIVQTADRSPVIIGTTKLAGTAKRERLRRLPGVEVLVTRQKGKKVSLKPFLRALGRKNFVNILVEGGGELAGSLLDEGLIDEVLFFVAPKLIGGGYSSVKGKGAENIMSVPELDNLEVKRSGSDILIRGTVCSRA